MSEKKCNSQEASFFVNDLFDTLDIKGNNQLLFNQFCGLLIKFDKETIRRGWKDVVYSCDPPNGQMAGRLPKLYIIEKILLDNRIENWNKEHQINKRQEIKQGTIAKLFDWGIEYSNGEITKQELEKKIEDNL